MSSKWRVGSRLNPNGAAGRGLRTTTYYFTTHLLSSNTTLSCAAICSGESVRAGASPTCTESSLIVGGTVTVYVADDSWCVEDPESLSGDEE